MLCWIDLETTGLSPEKHAVLEVAAIMTDDHLNEIARFHAVTNEASRLAFRDLDPYVQEMHTVNGLWMESAKTLTAPKDLPADQSPSAVAYRLNLARHLSSIDAKLADFIAETVLHDLTKEQREAMTDAEIEKRKPQLAGSTISFDRSFLARHLPSAHAQLHYRNVDVTTLNELARRFWPAVHDARPRSGDKKHRAMDDILESIAVCRHYLERLGPIALATPDSAATAA